MEKICVWINNLMRKPDLSRAKSNDAYAEWEFGKAKENEKRFLTHFSLLNKKILDVGCGFGGESTYWGKIGAKEVVGIDIKKNHIKFATSFCKKKSLANKVKFVVADAVNLPFVSNTFDVIFISATFEHLYEPLKSLEEFKRVLKVRGFIFLEFENYFGPYGCHLNWHIFIPWCHLFFSDKTLLNAIAKIEKDLHYSQYESIKEFQHLNGITIHEFKKIVQKTDLKIEYFELIPAYITRIAPLRKLFRFFTSIPLLNEIFTWEVLCILKKLKDT